MRRFLDQRIKTWKLTVKLSGALVALIILHGCANLEEVRDFSNQSAALAAAPQAVDYWVGWGERSKRFDAILNRLPPKNGIKAEGPVGPNSTLTKPQIEAVKSLHALLAAYMTKLGALADDDLVDVSKQVDGLVTNLDALPLATDEKKKANAAYGSILKLVKLPLNGYRHYKLKELIVENDGSVQQLTNILATSLGSISKFISAEKYSVLSWYDETTRQYPIPANFTSAYQWEKDKRSVVEIYDNKAEAIAAYDVALRKVGEMHHKMAMELSSFNTDSFKRLVGELKVAKNEISKTREEYKAAFKN
ncbi:hypothetical protein [Pseudomonas brassicacearum]|uniref:Uncharacterized protein n=1 Tax=Pseudomonas brassicacearum subsp. neoaurantiaca TaxID=494916 RepID=A0A7V8RHN0_9PSED|nr:hypothetical protein [Pseudomonas brassicacearum]MBA1376677.1 hypothetical protein [Pseudomonas brassicacearum subsp. neoaurantiaca]